MAQLSNKIFYRVRGTVYFDFNSISGVEDPTCQAIILRIGINSRPETNTLNDSLNKQMLINNAHRLIWWTFSSTQLIHPSKPSPVLELTGKVSSPGLSISTPC